MADKVVNKVVYNGETLIDLTNDDVEPSQVLLDKTFHYKDGTTKTGTMPNNSTAINVTLDDTTATTTIPLGYTPGGTVQHNLSTIPNPTINIVNITEGETVTGAKIQASGSWTKGFTTNSSYSGESVLSTVAADEITPSTTDQTAVAAGKYTLGAITVKGDADLTTANIKDGTNIFGVVGSFSDASTITGTDVTAAAAANILKDKAAFLDGAQVTGTMPNNGETGGTITAQGGTYTIPAGYTSGGTVTASLTENELQTSAITGVAVEEASGDYGWKTTVTVPAGYYKGHSVEKTFSDIFPAPETPVTVDKMLLGYQAYNGSGVLMTGTMPNNADWERVLDDTTTSVTIPEGYHDGEHTVSHATVDIPNPTITVDTTNGKITASGSWTKGFTTDNSYTNTISQTTQNGSTISPTETEQTAVAANTYTLGAVKIGAISSSYVGSAITRRTSDDMTVSADKITAPAGYYATAATKPITGGTEGTPTAAKGTVTDITEGGVVVGHQMNVTPSVTNTAGYIAGGTHTGTAATVTDSELTSGTKEITAGTSDTTQNISMYQKVTVKPTPTETGSLTPAATPTTYNPTSGKYYSSVTVLAVPTTSVENAAGGLTYTILPTA